MLTDRATINVRAGRGGAGSVSLRREKHVPRGGPDGGDGGRGADVVLVASRQVRDLTAFRHKVHYRAGNGGHGSGQKRHGKDGESLLVEVPVGTEVRQREGGLLADLVEEGQSVVVARGGEGGRGNVCFTSSTRRTPHFAERGLPGDELWLQLRLKLIADVGLVGLPNAGKSSLLAALTRAHPRIAAYPFTTLEPNLGTLVADEATVVLADIPGLVEGASEGIGLGDRFLAHVERTRALVYVIDAAAGPQACGRAFATVRGELAAFAPELESRPGVLALNKADAIGGGEMHEVLDAVAPDARAAGFDRLAVSAVTGEGLDELVREIGKLLVAARAAVVAPPADEEAVILRPGGERVDEFSIVRENDVWQVRGAALERLVAKADLDNEEAVRYLQEVMERAGLSAALRRAGGRDGDTIVIGEAEFELA